MPVFGTQSVLLLNFSKFSIIADSSARLVIFRPYKSLRTPKLRGVQKDSSPLPNHCRVIEVIDDLLCVSDDIECFPEAAVSESGAALKLLGDTELALPSSFRVHTLPHVLQSSRGEDLGDVYVRSGGIVGS